MQEGCSYLPPDSTLLPSSSKLIVFATFNLLCHLFTVLINRTHIEELLVVLASDLPGDVRMFRFSCVFIVGIVLLDHEMKHKHERGARLSCGV